MHKTLFLSTLLLSPLAGAQSDWEVPFPPHRMLGDLYYIGTQGLASYLIDSGEGLILINSDFETTVPLLRESVEALGFAWNDVRIVLGSHAHGDHMEGDGLIKEQTGAQIMAMEQDVALLEALRPGGVDRVLKDGESVTLGRARLTAVLTAGHTPGCTTWTFQVEEAGETHDVAIACSYGANPDYRLVDNPDYPTIAEDYRRTFATARALPVDVFLASHGFFFDLEGKYAVLQARAEGAPNPYVDREGLAAYVDEMERNFEAMLREQEGGR